jgi:large subunit ribosomal protein L17
MRTVYHKQRGWETFKRKKFVLERNFKQRWHFIRILTTQLIEHERIKITAVRARHLKPTVNRVITLARRFLKSENEMHFRMCQRFLTTEAAVIKLFKEILPRLDNVDGDPIKVVKLQKFRRGDNAQMGYIEITGNEIAQYEKAMNEEEEKKRKGPHPRKWHLKILHQELEMFQEKLATAKLDLENLSLDNVAENVSNSVDVGEMMNQRRVFDGMVKFYDKKVRVVEHELYCMTKHQWERTKFATY